ncbi:transporter [Diplocloster hominis]|uniref:transporter n=1 Tax=Diplocloster hominis TaxID=3079010 RepID=UPI0031BA6BC3
MTNSKVKTFFMLHLLIMVYSMSGILSKMAAKQHFLSFQFCLYYSLIILLLAIYAIGWQQIIKKLPLTTAYSNKAVTIVWGLVWGFAFFRESITLGKIIGSILVLIGVVIFARADEEKLDEHIDS